MFLGCNKHCRSIFKYIHSDLPYCDKCSKSFIGTEYKLLMQSYSMLPRYGIEKLQIGEIEKNMFAVANCAV